MKKIFTILALISAILSVIMAVLPISNMAFFLIISALLFGSIAFSLSKKAGSTKKIIQFIFLLTVIALALSAYKAIFPKTETTNTQKPKEVKESVEKDTEELDLDDISKD